MASVKSSSRIRGESTYLFGRDGLLGGLGEFFNGLGVVTKIHLAANKDDGKALAEVKNLGNPLDKSQSYAFKTKPLSLLVYRHGRSHFHLSNNLGATERTFSWTLSSESGESTAKQIKMTWESG